MNISNELDELARSLKLYRFRNELNFYKSQNDEKNLIRIEKLTKIINSLESTQLVQNKDKIQHAFDDGYKFVYMKPWRRLQDFHKVVKIKEFVEERYKDEKNKGIIEKMLLEAIEKKQLNKDNYVKYDQNISKIIDIPALKQDNDGNFKIILSLPRKRIVVKK